MRISVFAPSERLSPFVRAFTVVETAEQPATRTLIPEPGLVLCFRYGGFACQLDASAAKLPELAITGLRASARVMLTSARAGAVLVIFREAGAARFFREPLHELFGMTLGLDALVPPAELERVSSCLANADGHVARVRSVEGFLWRSLRSEAPDPLVAKAVHAIRSAPGTMRVAELARELGMSRDRLEKRFRHVVGTSPKQLASTLRLRRAIELARSGTNLTRVSLDAGYFDQSHFIREFRAFTGKPPGEFFRSVEHC